MKTLPSAQSPLCTTEEREAWIAPREKRQSLVSHALALVEEVQSLAIGEDKSQQAAWLEHIAALGDLVHFAECADIQSRGDRRKTPTIQQLRAFGALLRDRRNAAGFSRVRLARRAKISDATVKFLETARNPPSRATLIRLLAVPELRLSWANVPGKLGGAPLAPLSLSGDAGQPGTEPATKLNCYLTPTLEPVQMVANLGRCLNGAGGLIDPASIYMDHYSAASYLALCQQHGPILEHRRRLPLAAIAKRIVAASSGGLSVVALGSGDAQSEVRLAQHLQNEQPRPDLRLCLVDSSQPLLSVGMKHATETIGGCLGVKVMAIQGDFHHLPRFATLDDSPDAGGCESARRCRVYCMFGGTLESVDHELRFAHHSLDAKPGDWLILDLQPSYGSPDYPQQIRRSDPLLNSPFPRAYEEWLSGPIHRQCKHVHSIDFSLKLDLNNCIPGSYGLDAVATVQSGERPDRHFVMFRWKRYDIAQLAQRLEELGWAHLATLPGETETSEPAVTLLLRMGAAMRIDDPSAADDLRWRRVQPFLLG